MIPSGRVYDICIFRFSGVKGGEVESRPDPEVSPAFSLRLDEKGILFLDGTDRTWKDEVQRTIVCRSSKKTSLRRGSLSNISYIR